VKGAGGERAAAGRGEAGEEEPCPGKPISTFYYGGYAKAKDRTKARALLAH